MNAGNQTQASADPQKQNPAGGALELSLPLHRTHVQRAAPALTGVGGGTLFVLWAQSLPKPWGLWLETAAPSVTVIVSAVYALVRRYLSRRELQLALAEAKRTLKEALQDPDTSQEHKESVRRSLEKLEIFDVQVKMQHIEALGLEVHSFDKERKH